VIVVVVFKKGDGGLFNATMSEIMILASVQIRYTITFAYMYFLCTHRHCNGTAMALKVHGEMAIPSCQPDLQVSRCTSA